MENQIFRGADVEWQPLNEPGVTGVYVKSLMYDAEAGRSPTILLKFDPGARYPVHNHPAGEEIYVLEGDIHLGKDHLSRGRLYLHGARQHPRRPHGWRLRRASESARRGCDHKPAGSRDNA